jgi:heat shock protein HslJ
MKRLFIYMSLFFGAAFIISSCTATKNVFTENQLHKKWVLTSIDSVSTVDVAKSHPFIELRADGTGGANAGCNQMFFTYKVLPGNKIKFSEVGSTMMACADMEAEKHLGKLIHFLNNYELRRGELILKIDGKEVIRGK